MLDGMLLPVCVVMSVASVMVRVLNSCGFAIAIWGREWRRGLQGSMDVVVMAIIVVQTGVAACMVR